MPDQEAVPPIRQHDQAAINPYAPTVEVAVPAESEDDVEAYRKRYLSHEASVKSIGSLYILGAILLIPIGILGLAAGIRTNAVGSGLFFVAAGVAHVVVAAGLLRLKNWARIWAVVFSVIGLLAVPIGTLLSVYFLYLLLSEKGRVVFSDDYKRVIEMTPHMKYKTPLIAWVLLAIFILAMLALVLVGIA